MPLPDFVQDNDITKALKKYLKEDASNRSKTHFSSVISPEDVTKCPKRLYYQISCKEPEILNSYIDFSHKVCIVDKWASYFSKCSKTILVDKNILVTHAEYNLAGKASAYIEFGKRRYVINVCPVDQECFEKVVDKSPRRKDVISTMIYLWLSELNHSSAILIYENNNNQDYVMYNVNEYQPIIRSVKSKCKEIMSYKMRGIPPSKNHYDESCNECTVCEYKNVCKKENK